MEGYWNLLRGRGSPIKPNFLKECVKLTKNFIGVGVGTRVGYKPKQPVMRSRDVFWKKMSAGQVVLHQH